MDMLHGLIALALVAAAPATPISAISAALTDSAAGWNEGKLDRFMAVYADDATYVTARGLVRGRSAIADRYRATFKPGGNARGTLSFAMLGERAIDVRHHLIFARWTLSGAKGQEAGMTTLLFERQPAGWRIVADHSS